MRARWTTLLGALSGLGTLLVAPSSYGGEPEKARCAAAYESAQELQRGESLSAARKQLVICQETCPGRLRKDCVAWLADIDAIMPTLVLAPRDGDGRLIRDARVSLDGELLTTTVDPSTEIAVDPGTHVVRFEHPELLPAEVRVTIHSAQRKREVALTLWRKPSPATPSTSSTLSAASSDGRRTAAYVFGIGGIAALALGGGLATVGHVKRAELRSECAPYCSQEDADTVVALWRVGGIAAIVGGVSLGIGTYLWLTPSKTTGAARSLWIGAAGPSVSAGGSFD